MLHLSGEVAEAASRRFRGPTEIQKVAFPRILSGRNVVLCSTTGSGKTEAAMLPIMQLVKQGEPVGVSVLYITPLKALNRDVHSRLVDLAKEVGLRIEVRHGDTPRSARIRQRLDPPDILVTTPETFQALMVDQASLRALENVRHVVIDEANELVQSKRGVQLSLGLTRFRACLKHDIQLICLSATVKSGHFVCRFFMENGEVIYLKNRKAYAMAVDAVQAPNRLGEVYSLLLTEMSSKAIIFVNTRHLAEALAKIGREGNNKVNLDVHHSSLSLDERLSVEDRLRKQKDRSVISTSSLELGIDVGELERVIQVGSPRTVEALAQRFGRAGHSVGAISKGVLIALNPIDLLEGLACADLLLSKWIEAPKIFSAPLDVLVNQLAAHLLMVREAKKTELFELVRSCFSFRNLSVADFEMVLSFLVQMGYGSLYGDIVRVGRRTRVYFLTHIGTIAGTAQFSVRDIVTRGIVGYLDSSFVEKYHDSGQEIALGNRVWEVVSVDFGVRSVLVRPGLQGQTTIPNWSGDTLPVDNYVSKRMYDIVCSRRRGAVLKDLRLLPGAQRALDRIPPVRELADKRICVVSPANSTGTVLVLAPLGTRGNRAMSIVLSEALADYAVRPLIVVNSAGIILRSRGLSSERVYAILSSAEPDSVFSWIERGVARYGAFTDRLFAVSRRLGFDVEKLLDRYGARRTHAILQTTLAGKEVLNEVMSDLLDIRAFLSALARGPLLIDKPSRPLSEFCTVFKESLLSHDPEPVTRDAILASLARRLDRKSYHLHCLSCFRYHSVVTVGSMPEWVVCPRCGSRFVGFVEQNDAVAKAALKSIRFGSRNDDERINHVARELVGSAEIHLDYGKRGVLVLSGFGIGPTAAKRILRKRVPTQEELYTEIFKAEQEFIRTREFWS